MKEPQNKEREENKYQNNIITESLCCAYTTRKEYIYIYIYILQIDTNNKTTNKQASSNEEEE